MYKSGFKVCGNPEEGKRKEEITRQKKICPVKKFELTVNASQF